MRFRLLELQMTDSEAQELKQQGEKSYEEVNKVLHHQSFFFVLKAIRIELISCYHNDPLASHFSIKKTCKLLARKYYWSTLRHNIEAYVKGYDVCLAFKAVCYKPYSDLQSLPVPTHRRKNLSMDFLTGLTVSINWKGNNYDSILVIINQVTKIVHYELVKITINAPGLAKVIINVVVQQHSLSDSIITNRSFFFILKFWSSLCYFLDIK